MAKFKERIKDRQVPEHAAKVINEEMVRMPYGQTREEKPETLGE